MDSILTFYDKALTETRKLLSENLLHNVMERIFQADSIDIYGMDTNYNTAQQASASWNEIGFKSNAFNSINHHYLNQMNKDRNVVSFIISHTGRNKAMIDAAEILQKQVSIASPSPVPVTLLWRSTVMQILPLMSYIISQKSIRSSIRFLQNISLMCFIYVPFPNNKKSRIIFDSYPLSAANTIPASVLAFTVSRTTSNVCSNNL